MGPRKYTKKPTGAKMEQPVEDLDELEDEDLAGLLEDEIGNQNEFNMYDEDDDIAGVLTGGATQKGRLEDSEEEDQDEDDMGALADVLGELQEDEELTTRK